MHGPDTDIVLCYIRRENGRRWLVQQDLTYKTITLGLRN